MKGGRKEGRNKRRKEGTKEGRKGEKILILYMVRI